VIFSSYYLLFNGKINLVYSGLKIQSIGPIVMFSLSAWKTPNSSPDKAVKSPGKVKGKTCCVTCDSSYDEEPDWVQCGHCNNWECNKCTKFTKSQLKLLGNDKIVFLCSNCKDNKPKGPGKDEIMEGMKTMMKEMMIEQRKMIEEFEGRLEKKWEKKWEEFEVIKGEIKVIEGKLDDVEEKINNVSQLRVEERVVQVSEEIKEITVNQKKVGEEVSNLNEKVKELAKGTGEDAVKITLDELEMREVRKRNVVIHGVPEFESKEVEDRKGEERLYLQKLCNIMQIRVKYRNISRLGKYGELKKGDKRPLLLMCDSEEDVYRIIGATSKLKGTELQHLGIHRDFTPLERKQWKDLKALRDEKQKETDEKGQKVKWVILKDKKTVVKAKNTEGTVEERKRWKGGRTIYSFGLSPQK
jgi:hypothetical protein